MHIQRLAAPLGAVIEGLNVREVTTQTWPDLNRLFNQYKVLVFRNQKLTPEDQANFASLWGPLVHHPYASTKAHPAIMTLTNYGKKKDVNQHWHSDMIYNPVLPKLTMLYGLEVPSIGGNTAFSNQTLAWAELSEGLRTTLRSLRAVHSAAGLARIYGEDPKKAPFAKHPVMRTHAETGEPALFVCREFTERFVGWSKAESAALLEYLFQHRARPEFQARQQWRRGDLVMWDNRCLLHFAVHDHGDEPRVIHRLQVEGETPQ